MRSAMRTCKSSSTYSGPTFLTKRLTETDSEEYQFAHDCFSTMLANPVTVVVEGQPEASSSATKVRGRRMDRREYRAPLARAR